MRWRWNGRAKVSGSTRSRPDGWTTNRVPANKDDEFSKTLLKYLPDNRLIKPEELGGALLYLVSPAAGFVTGESIAVDGAIRARV